MNHWKLNTSNQGKFEEFKRLFALHGASLEATHIDLKEIDADPITVTVHKASQFEEVLVEDSSLDVDGAQVGIHVKSLLSELENFLGRKAHWMVLLAYKKRSEVLIYRGVVSGTIVRPKGGSGFGFDPVFLPDGASCTLAEEKPDEFNARAKAVEALMKNKVFEKRAAMDTWEGPWQ